MPTVTPTATLSKSTIRDRARAFAAHFCDARSESALRQLFWIRFFEIFDVKAERVGAFEQIAQRASTGRHGWIDLLWPGQLAVEHKSAGRSLDEAMTQVLDYYTSLSPAQCPWLLVACDFQTFFWKDLKRNLSGQFALSELPENLDLFWWIAGYNTPHQSFESIEDANLEATRLLAQLHDSLAGAGYPAHDVREWLTRILFCLFADDTGVWDRAAFHSYLALHSNPDGSNLGATIETIFQVLNTAQARRSTALGEELSAFTYINGDLFAERLSIPFCDTEMREGLLRACTFNWAVISPAIFGSMFQNVMTPAERRSLGAHYTSEANILRTIRPLFLDGLEAELASADSRPKLRAFLDKLPSLTFFDPACGCGNFLVLSYREVRRLETEALRLMRRRAGHESQRTLDLTLEMKVRVDQFYGIEIEEFPAKIARVALYLADHLANRAASAEFGQHYVRFPIPATPHIECRNALAFDWNELLPAARCNFLFGNPPFVGMSYLSAEQQADNRRVFAAIRAPGLRSGRLDYVACWYAKALLYARNQPLRCAFVSTNSLTQGEQARSLGPLLEREGFRVDFAHTSFKWTSEARGSAQVTVVIIGFSSGLPLPRKRLFLYEDLRGDPVETGPENINWYLADGPAIYPSKRRSPFFSSLPKATQGSKPWDGGGLIVSPAEHEEVRRDPIAARYLRPFRQTRELLYGTERWCLWLVGAQARDLRNSRVLAERLERVRQARETCDTPSVQRQASTPSLFSQIRQPTSRYLAIPEVSSESRSYVPMRYYEPDVIAGNKLITVEGAPLWLFGVLQSAMFMAWIRTIVGRLETRYSLAPDLAYNCFPFPIPEDRSRRAIEEAGAEVLRQRDLSPDSSLDDLYGENSMPPDLVRAHHSLDVAVDHAYALRRRLLSDADRLKVLLSRYVELEQAERLGLEPRSATRASHPRPPRSRARRVAGDH